MALAKVRAGEWLVILGSAGIVVFAVIAGIMIYHRPPPVRFVYLDNPLAKAGEKIFRGQGCDACHQLFGSGYGYGPDLDGVGSKRTRAWLTRYMRDPWPGVSAKPYRLKMPGYGVLPEKDFEALLDFLIALREVDLQGEMLKPDGDGPSPDPVR